MMPMLIDRHDGEPPVAPRVRTYPFIRTLAGIELHLDTKGEWGV
jgi:hypothetical protein